MPIVLGVKTNNKCENAYCLGVKINNRCEKH